jgi:hypothetical protein
MYKNSVRYNPTPSPPFLRTDSTSSGLPILAANSTCLPSFVTLFSLTSLDQTAIRCNNSIFFCLYSLISEGDGLIIATPSSPSRITISPFLTDCKMF